MDRSKLKIKNLAKIKFCKIFPFLINFSSNQVHRKILPDYFSRRPCGRGS
ncbi:hypothetical protein ANHYDRO_01345 [Anaerococcus hydrogenalis DSM 7454]|uniref:Uncharacterized protein n=1 Tax=Anaerococcus hydrogenalis DSM 7454 TaxID=561177 RepID=B6W9S0_9FIRM|nr:hypothetical protein ANHYDRO_01345 [Anaerococcus hydrogenalis DSM 7454]